MARSLTRGQRAAVRAAIDRRGALGLTQEQLAERAGVSAKTLGNFERGLSWPHARTIGQIERLGLNWPVGWLRELADDVDNEDPGGHRYETRAKAARIHELEDRIARDRAELEELTGDMP